MDIYTGKRGFFSGAMMSPQAGIFEAQESRKDIGVY